MLIFVYINIHAYTHTYIHTYIHTQVTGEARRGTGALNDEAMKVTVGGATKMESGSAPEAKKDDEKRSMEV
jgi:hypothetical protein